MGRRAALLDNVVNAFRCGAVVQGDSGISEAEKKMCVRLVRRVNSLYTSSSYSFAQDGWFQHLFLVKITAEYRLTLSWLVFSHL